MSGENISEKQVKPMSKDPGRKWPIIIALSIAGIIALSAGTVKVAIDNPVQMSDYGMQNYHTYDRDVNEIIEAKIAFDRKYTIAFLTPQIAEKGTALVYKITDKAGRGVDNAKIEAILTRPDSNRYDIPLASRSAGEGKYTFQSVDLPKPGRWDILAKVTVGKDSRYYNLKADTRNPNTFEF